MRVDFKSSNLTSPPTPHTHITTRKVTDALMNLTAVIISQWIHTEKHHAAGFTFIQFCQLLINETRKNAILFIINPRKKKYLGVNQTKQV